VGDINNPIVFPKQANYSQTLLHADNGKLTVSHTAAGADKWRYSLNWGTTYSNWLDYKGGIDTLAPTVWSGTKEQAWDGDHVIVEYWSKLAGSNNHIQHGDANWENKPPRRVPHLWLEGPWNQYGFDAGLANQMRLDPKTGLWTIHFMTEWPAQTSISVWGINPDGQPDQTQIFGDIDGDNVLDRLPLKSLLGNFINVTDVPQAPHLSYRISLNDATLRYELISIGSRWAQLALWILLALIPLLTGIAAVYAYLQSFSQIKFNKVGIADQHGLIPWVVRRRFKRLQEKVSRDNAASPNFLHSPGPMNVYRRTSANNSVIELPRVSVYRNEGNPLHADAGAPNRRTVLIATMEYDIEDWGIKIKIGGLGVMAQLM
jgi:alpha-1,3-glucan synthase